MSDDEKKPPVRLYHERIRLTPEGTQFSSQPTKESQEQLRELARANEKFAVVGPDPKTVSERFNKWAKIKPQDKTKFKRAEKKDRGDFEL